jgi:hypothetical protein
MVEISEWKMDIVNLIKKKLKKKKNVLKFVHIPKCGGSYAGQYLDELNIINKGHIQANENDKLTFTIIRHPVNRLESLLNYRLNAPHPRRDWPERLNSYHYDKTKTLDDIINNMTDIELKSFYPFKTLKYWTKNVKLIITIDEFIPILEYLGYKITKKYNEKNVSEKNRGKISIENEERIKRIYSEDLKIYEYWTRKD